MLSHLFTLTIMDMAWIVTLPYARKVSLNFIQLCHVMGFVCWTCLMQIWLWSHFVQFQHNGNETILWPSQVQESAVLNSHNYAMLHGLMHYHTFFFFFLIGKFLSPLMLNLKFFSNLGFKIHDWIWIVL